MLLTRIRLLTSLPLAKLDRLALKRNLDESAAGHRDQSGPRALAEFVGTALLLAVVVGSGTMGERLAAGNDGIAAARQQRCDRLRPLRPDPRVRAGFGSALQSLGQRCSRGRRGSDDDRAPLRRDRDASPLSPACARSRDVRPCLFWAPSVNTRSGLGHGWPKALQHWAVLTIIGARRFGIVAVAAAVAAYICGAYWFTASTSFANPVVTLARAFTPTFTGISPESRCCVRGRSVPRGPGRVCNGSVIEAHEGKSGLIAIWRIASACGPVADGESRRTICQKAALLS